MQIEQYFKKIAEDVDKCFVVANAARAKGLDPVSEVEVPIATTLAEKAVGLVSTMYPQMKDSGIDKRIIEMEKEYGELHPAVSFKIAEEIAREKFCKFESLLQAIEAGVRIGFAYNTLGVVSSPLEGFTELKLGKTRDGKDYFKAYFSGPIRSAGTTASCLVLMIIDYLRETFGYAKYDPDENEIKRYVTENFDYHDWVTNLQYLPTEDEILFLAKNMPICIAGEPTEKREVSNYKDLPREDTNCIRGGMCLIFSEGLAQKAQKGFRLLKSFKDLGFVATGWDFLEEFIEKFKMAKKDDKGGDNTPVYIKDLVAGRPVYGHPSRSGGFRFRYGRSRVGGFSAMGVHPATMTMSGDFLSNGTQLKIEKPTKGCAIAACDEMDGPIVKLKDGSVKKLSDIEEARNMYASVEEILYLGDLLVSFDDILNRNYDMLKTGYVEEWWELELEKAGGKIGNKFGVSFLDAVKLSKEYGVGLHPRWIYYWKEIDKEQFLGLIDWIAHGEVMASDDALSPQKSSKSTQGLSSMSEGKVVLPYDKMSKERFVKGKRGLELLGVEHIVSTENVVIGKEDGGALLFNLGLGEKDAEVSKDTSDTQESKEQYQRLSSGKLDVRVNGMVGRLKDNGDDVLTIVNSLCSVRVRDKSGTWIGARMGRPEKAKLRKLAGSPHVLFPVGAEGGRLRSFLAAHEVGHITGDFPLYHCDKCKKDTIYRMCEVCGDACKKMTYCPRCEKSYGGKCEEHDYIFEYKNRKIDIRHYFDNVKKKLGISMDELGSVVKGVRGTSNQDHSCEHLGKGLLRAKHGLNVNKDGTIRYDMTEMAMTHFKPDEIGTSVEKLKELGYEKDILGENLERDDQILCMFPHDVILPACVDGVDEKADDVFLSVSKFVDDELEKLYGLEKFFKVEKKRDIVGELLVCLAPHICTGTVGRIIGFSKTQMMLASPYMHAAMRRDCLGYDNYVSIKEDGKWKIKKIGVFVQENNPVEKLDSWGSLGKKIEGLYTWSNPGQKQVLELTKHEPRKMLKISLEDGRKIEVTDNHKMYLKGKVEKRAVNLEQGDKLMVSCRRNVEERDIDEIFLPELFKDRDDVMIRGVFDFLNNFEKMGKHDNYTFRDSFPIKFVKDFLEKYGKDLKDLPNSARIAIKRDTITLPLRIKFDEDLMSLIGLYIAEGYMRQNTSEKGFYHVYFSAQDEEVREFIFEKMKKIFGLKPSEKKLDRLNYSSHLLYDLFKEYFGLATGARNKRIPSMFLDLKNNKLAALLRGYYEGDGSVSLSDIRVTADSVSEGLKHDLSFVLSRFGIFCKFYEYEKEPGPKVREFYIRKNREIPKFKITKIIIPSNFVEKFKEIGFLSERKGSILQKICERNPTGMRMDCDENYVYPKVVKVEDIGEKESYCFNVADEHNFFANDMLVHNCDGDESAVMLLMDMLINFSRKFLPSHRGGTQDAPLVLNTLIRAGDVDDQILDFGLSKYPLEMYEAAEEGKHSSEVKCIENVKNRLAEDKDVFTDIAFTHGCSSMNSGVNHSSYKSLPTMAEKVAAQMELCKKIRAVDTSDVARLIIERHFIRDTLGNLRKFSMQSFRCVGCNEIYRRVPLAGKCGKCSGRLIYTISEGSIMKYMQPALDLARKYEVKPYLLECLELAEMYIHSIFGKETEKQEEIGKWM